MKYPIAFALTLAFASFSCSVKAEPVAQTAAQPVAQAAARLAANPRPISYAELQAALAAPDSSVLIVDVRTREEFDEGHIPDSLLFPYDLIEASAKDFSALAGSPDRSIVVYCRSGRRSAIAAESLVKLGYANVADLGPLAAWKGSLEK
ncbi:MAG: hypothetical protein A2Z99_16355 [Treponema sp. GWB1_62_6]|nr:MAG: hypothetical protein A2001_09245 [Treponema sp. GWC1_61_84]OHE64567.1 MAG: hypothetical protein A2Z99_16355 [Treponema sp. GWB1_62_6]